MKNRKATIFLIVLLLVFGLAFSFYPALSNRLFTQRSVYTIDKYEKDINILPQEVREAEWEEARVYNNMLRESAAGGMFVSGSGTAPPTNYLETLNVGKIGIMGVLEIPGIKVKLPIYHGVSEEVLKKGVGHIEGTSLPIGGNGTHAFLTTHTGLPSAKLFSDLDELVIGDVFNIRIMEKKMFYQVENISVVAATDTFVFAPIDDKDLVTLITCTPYGVNSHRLLVQGIRVYLPDDMPEANGAERSYPMLWQIIIWLVIATLVILLVVLSRLRWKMKH